MEQAISIPTPRYPHLKSPAYRDVYEPAEDSFLFMDALEQDASFIRQLKYLRENINISVYLYLTILISRPLICVEVGSGSGAILAFLANLLCAPCFLW